MVANDITNTINSRYKDGNFAWLRVAKTKEVLLKGSLSKVDLLIKISCCVKNVVSVWKAADLNLVIQGGQLY